MTGLGSRLLPRLVLTLAAVTAAIFLTTRFIAIPWVVLGPSMEPTLLPGDRVVVDLWTYGRHRPAAGEVALFLGPEDVPLVKRIVDGPLLDAAPFQPGAWGSVDLDEDLLEVAGDNREESSDSRRFGPVPRHRFRGRILWRYWPVSRAGRIR